MQRIVIPVEDNIAQTWESASPDQRVQLIKLFSWVVEQGEWQRLTPERFAHLLDQISDKAEAKGLSPEVLAEILDEK